MCFRNLTGFDENKHGVVTRRAFHICLVRSGLKLEEANAHLLADLLDVQCNGHVGYAELLSFIEEVATSVQAPGSTRGARLWQAMAQACMDESGSLLALRNWMASSTSPDTYASFHDGDRLTRYAVASKRLWRL
jgi:hypothetical protein